MKQEILIKKKFWESTNFWILVGLFASSLFIVREDIEPLIQQIVGGISGIISAVMLIRNMIKDGKFKLEWSRISNSIAYLGLIINGIVEQNIPEETWGYLSTIAESLMAGNWQGAVGAAFPLFAILLNLFKNKGTQPNLQAA